ncbi:MAG: YigZ family protein [Clostridiales bacterium]|nr:YigZ family protein [Clostridiales bacterium]
MSLVGGYYTLGQHGSEEFIERKSRFIGEAAPAFSEEEALSFIKNVKDAHKSASHHCFAYIIGENAGLMRYSDDGEPQGTAGIPILDVLKKNDLVNCVAVVTRYFGGVLLGAGGLTRAYSAGCAKAVRAAGIVTAQSSLRLSAVIGYAYWDAIDYLMSKLPVCELEREFTDKVLLRLTVREQDAKDVIKEIIGYSDGSAQIEQSDPFYHQWQLPPPEADA